MINSTVRRNFRKILLFFNILLGSLGAWMVFDVVSFWVSSPDGGKEHAIRPKVEVASTQATLVAPRSLGDYEALSKADIFRISPRSNPPMGARTNPQGQKATALDLKLKGTILGNNTKSYAVIEDGKTKTQLLYSLNEPVQGAKIIVIEPDHVVLSAQGKNEVLTMSEEDEPKAISVGPSPMQMVRGAKRGQRNRESRSSLIEPMAPHRIEQADRNDASTRELKFPSAGQPAGAKGSQSDDLNPQAPEDQPSQ
jgi:type II secretion system protein C